MPRSIFDPSDIDLSIRKLSTGKGRAFTHLYTYLSNPDTKQLVLPTDKPYFLKNLRSDLSSWRTAFSQVPPSRLLTIPWLALIADSRPDLLDKDDFLKTRILMENIRLYTTKLTPDGLYIGSYLSLETSFEAPLTFVTPNQYKPVAQTTKTPVRDFDDIDPNFLPPSKHIKAKPADILNKYLKPESTKSDSKINSFVDTSFDDGPDDGEILEAERTSLEQEQADLELIFPKERSAAQKKRLIEIETRISKITDLLNSANEDL